MKLTDLHPFAPTWRGFVPGMLTEDQPVWYRWLDQHLRDFDMVYYNVELALPETMPKDVEPKYAKLWQTLTARRVDVVAVKENARTVIEVATRLQPSNIGRVIAYEELWPRVITDGPITRTLILYVYGTNIDAAVATRVGFDVERIAP